MNGWRSSNCGQCKTGSCWLMEIDPIVKTRASLILSCVFACWQYPDVPYHRFEATGEKDQSLEGACCIGANAIAKLAKEEAFQSARQRTAFALHFCRRAGASPSPQFDPDSPQSWSHILHGTARDHCIVVCEPRGTHYVLPVDLGWLPSAMSSIAIHSIQIMTKCQRRHVCPSRDHATSPQNPCAMSQREAGYSSSRCRPWLNCALRVTWTWHPRKPRRGRIRWKSGRSTLEARCVLLEALNHVLPHNPLGPSRQDEVEVDLPSPQILHTLERFRG